MKKQHKVLAAIFLLVSAFSLAQPVNGVSTFFTNTTTALAANTSCSITKTVSLDGWLFSVSSSSNCGFNQTNTSGGDGRIQYLVGFGTLTQATFGSDNGNEFALQSLTWGVSTSSWTSKAMTFVGYKNGMAVPGATLNATTPSGTGILNTLVVNFGGNSAFNDVDDIALAPNSATCNSILFFEDITVSTATPACSGPTLSVSGSSNVLCNGQSNGSATMSASGGSGFTYTWTPSGGSAATATGLSAGIYTLSCTNSTCTNISTRTVQITQPAALVTSTGVTNALCNGANGSATVAASGGTGAYSYTWSSGPTSSVEPTLLAGTYTVKVTDANSCSSTKSVTITQPSALVTSTGVTNALCNGANGSATVTASGGTGAYSYTWSSGPTSSVEPTLLAGTYTVKVSDANSCSSTKSVTITQPSALVTSSAVTNALCNGANGSATITASGGTGAYTYSWSSGPTTSVISAVPAGVYTATVTDANNCTGTKTITIAQPAALVTSTAVTNVPCNGGNGSATITASGGTGAYTYSWSSGATTSVMTNLAGAYTATVTDANSCTGLANITLTQPSALVTSTGVTNALCNGGNGSATITASGGTGAYTYLWSSAATSSVMTNLAGVYTATVTDANSCNSIKTITITQPSALVTTTAVTNVLCNGGNGSATVTASGGTGAYTYSWSSGATTSVITNIAGTYTVSVTDANNCTSVKNSVITQPASLLSSISVTNVLCNGGTGSAKLTSSGGTGAYTYSWSSGSTNSIITNIAGVYTATVTDANSCAISYTVPITQPLTLVNTTSVINAACNAGNGSATIIVSGGTTPYTYLWSSSATASVLTNLAGVYTATVTDANSCKTTNSVVITQPPALTLTAVASSPSVCSGSSCTLSSGASGGTGTYTYSWSAGSTASVCVVNPTVSSVYTITILDANNCTASQTVSLMVGNLPTITVNSGSICLGQSFTINPSGAVYYFYPGSGGIVYPIVTTTYVVYGQAANLCGSQTALTVTVIPSPTIVTSNYTICSGETVTLAPTGAYTYTFSSGSTTISPVVSPTATTAYTITGTSIEGCDMGGYYSVSNVYVNSTTISVNSGSICAGEAFTLNPSGALSYTFASGLNIVTPANTSTYAVIGTGTNGCVSSVAIAQVSVLALPTLSLSNGSVCPGYSFTLNPQGASTYTYLNGGPVVSPSVTTIYSVTGTSPQGCPASNTVTAVVTVTNTLAVSIAGTNIICSGQTTTLTASGASTYSWSTNATTSTLSLNPYVNTSYTAYGFSGSCSNSAIVTVTVKPSPTVSITGPNSLCSGETITLTASGGDTYLWDNSSTSNSIVVNPTTSANYTVIGTYTNNCSSTQIHSLAVYTLPTITVNDGTICAGSTYTIIPSGANTYSYSGGTAVVSPTSTTSYSITGTSAQGCPASNTAIVSVNVNALPALSANDGTICAGSHFTMVPYGAATYSYSSGAAVVSPTSTTSYSITGTGAQGCAAVNTVVVSVMVNPLPIISVLSTNSLICAGETASLTVSGASSYTWNTGSNNSVIVISPTSLTNYTVVGMDANSCMDTVNFIQDVSACTGINSLTGRELEGLQIYPNPSNGVFTIEIARMATLSIRNTLGELVLQKTVEPGKQTIDLQQEARGVYFVEIIAQGRAHVVKIIKE